MSEPTEERVVCGLNGVWRFKFSADHQWSDENIGRIIYDDLIAVPAAFDALPAYYGKRGVGFYRRAFTVPSGRRARLSFGAVGMCAKVFVDGEKLAEQYAAYTPFTADLPVSKRAERDLVVMVANRFDPAICPLQETNFDFYAYGGIFRTVELILLPAGDLIEWVGIDTLDYRTGRIRVRLRPARPGQKISVAVDDEPSEDFVTGPVVGDECALEMQLKKFSAWSPERPVLHCLRVSNGTDASAVRFGVRQVAAADGRILINGKPVKLLGYCRHEAHPQYGPALPLSQLVADLQLLRELGCNFIRGAHYQQDPRFLDLCDELGFLVFEESLAWGQPASRLADPGFIAAQLAQTAAMIATGYNHPSVIIRGFLNEGASDQEESRPCYEALVKLIREKDPGRLVTSASNRELRDRFLELYDVVSFNIYPGWYAENSEDERPLGEIGPRIRRNLAELQARGLAAKPYLISEIGAGAIYGWRDAYCAHWSEEYQCACLGAVCREVIENDAVAGMAIWQFCDCRTYRGAGALMRPRAFNNKGSFDEYRRPKLVCETVRRIFREYNNEHS